MGRGLDHIVHAVRDLDAGAAFYRRLGFHVGARNRHPWGTHNHIVQLHGFFIEILTMAEPDKLGEDGLSRHFGAFHRDYLARREGLSCLVLESADTAGDAAAFKRAGIAASEMLTFAREATRPDGASVTVGFAMAFARDPLSPDAAFTVCRQLNPENFWSSAMQTHANSARDVAGVVLVAENPTDHHAFLAALTGVRDLHATSAGVRVTTPRGILEIVDPTAFRDRYGIDVVAKGEGMRLAALRVTVADPQRVRQALTAGRIDHRADRGRLIVAPEHAMGATLVFE